MSVRIYRFPPVGAVASMWTQVAPVQRSRNLFSGRRAVSAAGPARIEAAVTVSALARGRMGAGYSEALKTLLDGGVHLVRAWSGPANWHLDGGAMFGSAGSFTTSPLVWQDGSEVLAWFDGGSPVTWFTGLGADGTPGSDARGDFVTVTGLPANRLVARPYDVVRVMTGANPEGVITRALAEARSDGSGVAVVRVAAAVPAGLVSLGDSESRVFEVVEMPRAMQPLGQDWFYEWRFIEVLPHEYAGAEEFNPW